MERMSPDIHCANFVHRTVYVAPPPPLASCSRPAKFSMPSLRVPRPPGDDLPEHADLFRVLLRVRRDNARAGYPCGVERPVAVGVRHASTEPRAERNRPPSPYIQPVEEVGIVTYGSKKSHTHGGRE